MANLFVARPIIIAELSFTRKLRMFHGENPFRSYFELSCLLQTILHHLQKF